jgi:hypothetical protein
MKEVRGIKTFSIGGIVLNGGLLVLFFCLVFVLSPISGPKASDIAGMLAIFLGFALCILYPVQLLRIRRNFYLHRLPSSGAKTFLHIYRIIQLIFTILMALVTAAGCSEVYHSVRYYESRPSDKNLLMIRGGVMVVLLATIVVNFTIFFKGWRLLKMVRKNYVDHVMESFD